VGTGKKVLWLVIAILAVSALYLGLWPVPAEPRAWDAPKPPGYVGPHAPNHRLGQLRHIDIGDDFGPEHIAIGPDGRLYVAMTSGNVLRMDADGAHRTVFANTGGRVLGFDFDADGRMIAADAMKGLLAIDAHGAVTLLSDSVGEGDPIRYANSLVIAPGGTIYFTDASGRFAPRDWGGTLAASVLDVLEQSATGRVLAYEPATGVTRIVAQGFSFANGIALSSDAHSLFVSETGRYRVWKVAADSRDLDIRAGSPRAQVFLDNLPGYPDNLMRGGAGRIWVGLIRPRNPAADDTSRRPFIRKILLRLPRSWMPKGEPRGHVFAFDESGRIVEDLQDPAGAYAETTGATETADRLYIHSLGASVLGWLPRTPEQAAAAHPDVGIEEIYVLRSVREPAPAIAGDCGRTRTGFNPLPVEAERVFSFWSVGTRAADGRIVDAHQARVASLRGCFGATAERARQNFYADVEIGMLGFHGQGECLALAINFPEPGLFPVRCQLTLSGLPRPYVGGLLTTNTMTSAAAFGGESNPPGYTQASIATLRLWKSRPREETP
jgi:sugar lactone lactonase YvrE